MKFIFNLSLRLLLAFLTVKFLLGIFGGGSPAMLLGGALSLVGLSYLITYLEQYYQRTWHSKAAELGWKVARFLIGLNQLKDKKPRP